MHTPTRVASHNSMLSTAHVHMQTIHRRMRIGLRQYQLIRLVQIAKSSHHNHRWPGGINSKHYLHQNAFLHRQSIPTPLLHTRNIQPKRNFEPNHRLISKRPTSSPYLDKSIAIPTTTSALGSPFLRAYPPSRFAL